MAGEGQGDSRLDGFSGLDCDVSTKENENSHVKVNVLFFARARDLTGLTDICLKMSSGSTANDCMSELLIMYPRLEQIRNFMLLAINEEYAEESTVLKDGDELAIIPPISGG